MKELIYFVAMGLPGLCMYWRALKRERMGRPAAQNAFFAGWFASAGLLPGMLWLVDWFFGAFPTP